MFSLYLYKKSKIVVPSIYLSFQSWQIV